MKKLTKRQKLIVGALIILIIGIPLFIKYGITPDGYLITRYKETFDFTEDLNNDSVKETIKVVINNESYDIPEVVDDEYNVLRYQIYINNEIKYNGGGSIGNLMSVTIQDFDGDGNSDILIKTNFIPHSYDPTIHIFKYKNEMLEYNVYDTYEEKQKQIKLKLSDNNDDTYVCLGEIAGVQIKTEAIGCETGKGMYFYNQKKNEFKDEFNRSIAGGTVVSVYEDLPKNEDTDSHYRFIYELKKNDDWKKLNVEEVLFVEDKNWKDIEMWVVTSNGECFSYPVYSDEIQDYLYSL